LNRAPRAAPRHDIAFPAHNISNINISNNGNNISNNINISNNNNNNDNNVTAMATSNIGASGIYNATATTTSTTHTSIPFNVASNNATNVANINHPHNQHTQSPLLPCVAPPITCLQIWNVMPPQHAMDSIKSKQKANGRSGIGTAGPSGVGAGIEGDKEVQDVQKTEEKREEMREREIQEEKEEERNEEERNEEEGNLNPHVMPSSVTVAAAAVNGSNRILVYRLKM